MTRTAIYAQKSLEVERKLFIALVGCIFLSVALYVYFVVETSVFASDHARMVGEINTLRSHVGDLEATYIAQNKTIDQAYAHTLGFADTNDVVFASLPVVASNAQTGNEI